jgi:hypothetical protein
MDELEPELPPPPVHGSPTDIQLQARIDSIDDKLQYRFNRIEARLDRIEQALLPYVAMSAPEVDDNHHTGENDRELKIRNP